MPARNPKGVYVVALYSYRPSRKEKLELVKVYFNTLRNHHYFSATNACLTSTLL